MVKELQTHFESSGRFVDGQHIPLGSLSSKVHSIKIVDILKQGQLPDWFEFWKGIKRSEIRKAIETNELEGGYVGQNNALSDPDELKLRHARKIAYLVRHPDSEPIALAVGSHYGNKDGNPTNMGNVFKHLEVIDGNHRLAAAIYRGDESINVEYFGLDKDFKTMFPAQDKNIAKMPSLDASGSMHVAPKRSREAIVQELKEYLEANGGPDWRTNPEHLPIKFNGTSKKHTKVIDVKKADDHWKIYPECNFRIHLDGSNEIGDRSERLLAWIKAGNNVEPPFGSVDKATDGLGFIDGRHRFALLRDAGVEVLPFNTVTPTGLSCLEVPSKELVNLPKVEEEIDWENVGPSM